MYMLCFVMVNNILFKLFLCLDNIEYFASVCLCKCPKLSRDRAHWIICYYCIPSSSLKFKGSILQSHIPGTGFNSLPPTTALFDYAWSIVTGYEKFNQVRQDPALCFLTRCGPPDGAALLAEQNEDKWVTGCLLARCCSQQPTAVFWVYFKQMCPLRMKCCPQ